MKIYKNFIFTNCIVCYIIHLVPNKTEYGGIAQLGEHLLCKQGVIGSIPIISTKAADEGLRLFCCAWENAVEAVDFTPFMQNLQNCSCIEHVEVL